MGVDTIPETKICPYCGEEIKSVAIKCKHCHKILSDGSSSDTDMEAEFHLPGVEDLRREDMWGIVHDDTFKAALVRGCAGSGKTTVAIHRLIRHAKQGHRVRLITFQNMLVFYIKNLVVKKELQIDDFITTFHAWYNDNYGYFDITQPPSVSEILTALEKRGRITILRLNY